jgi:hypothetical protein
VDSNHCDVNLVVGGSASAQNSYQQLEGSNGNRSANLCVTECPPLLRETQSRPNKRRGAANVTSGIQNRKIEACPTLRGFKQRNRDWIDVISQVPAQEEQPSPSPECGLLDAELRTKGSDQLKPVASATVFAQACERIDVVPVSTTAFAQVCDRIDVIPASVQEQSSSSQCRLDAELRTKDIEQLKLVAVPATLAMAEPRYSWRFVLTLLVLTVITGRFHPAMQKQKPKHFSVLRPRRFIRR